MALEYIKPGVHRYQARDKRWVELEWKGRTIVVRRPEGSSQKTFRTPDEARAWVVRFDRSMHNKLFSRVTRVVRAGRLAKPTLPERADGEAIAPERARR